MPARLSLSLSPLLFRRKALLRMCTSVGLTGDMWTHLARVNLPFFKSSFLPSFLLLIPLLNPQCASVERERRPRRGRALNRLCTLKWRLSPRSCSPPEKRNIMTVAFVVVKMNFSQCHYEKRPDLIRAPFSPKLCGAERERKELGFRRREKAVLSSLDLISQLKFKYDIFTSAHISPIHHFY